MFNRAASRTLYGLIITLLLSAPPARADTLTNITSQAAQGANDSVAWSQLGVDAAALPTSFAASSAHGLAVAGSFAGSTPTSLIAVVCSASPCSWAGGTNGTTPFTAGDSLIWTSDGANSGNGPLTLSFSSSVSGVGALIHEDAPGQFTAEIQVFNGASSVGSFSESSDSAGDPIYVGVKDTSGANITKAVFSITSTTNPAGDVSDFAIDAVQLNDAGGPPPPAPLEIHPTIGNFGKVKVRRLKTIKFALTYGATSGPPITISGESVTDAGEFSIISSKNNCPVGTVLKPGNLSCTMVVAFRPQGKGIRPHGGPPATLTLQDDASNAPQSVTLKGRGF